jgi:hypothetical protein
MKEVGLMVCCAVSLMISRSLSPLSGAFGSSRPEATVKASRAVVQKIRLD